MFHVDNAEPQSIKKKQAESGVVVHTCNPSYPGSGDKKILGSNSARAKLARLLEKRNTETKGLGA
jgi:radical SAM superfamily enzyme with C-terminal helix-hairpin-helix motif